MPTTLSFPTGVAGVDPAIAGHKPESAHNFVLIIGVDHYPQMPGAGLKGSVNDAHWWRRLCAEALVCPAENVRACLSPVGGVVPEGAHGATAADVLDGVKWLGAAMQASAAAGNSPSGLVVFSGHGAATNAADGFNALGTTIAMCCSDLHKDGDHYGGTVSLAMVQGLLAAAVVERTAQAIEGGKGAVVAALHKSWLPDVTIVLDCCYARPDAAEVRLGEAPKAIQDAAWNIDQNICRIALACNPWEVAYQMRSNGLWHGAFSFALLTLLEQWKVQRDAGRAWFEVTLQNLLRRSDQMLRQLGLEQSPVMMAIPRAGLSPFLRPGLLDVGAGVASPEPNAHRPTTQISTPDSEGSRPLGIKVTCSDGSEHLAACVIAQGTAGLLYTPQNYWIAAKTESWYRKPFTLNAGVTITGYKVVYEGYTVDGSGQKTYSYPFSNEESAVQALLTRWGAQSMTPIRVTPAGLFWNSSVSCSAPTGTSGPVCTNASSVLAPNGFQLSFTVSGPENNDYILRTVTYTAASSGPAEPSFFGVDDNNNDVTLTPPPQTLAPAPWWRVDFTMGHPNNMSVDYTQSGDDYGLPVGARVSYAVAQERGNGSVGRMLWWHSWHTLKANDKAPTVSCTASSEAGVAAIRFYRRVQNNPMVAACIGRLPASSGEAVTFTDTTTLDPGLSFASK